MAVKVEKMTREFVFDDAVLPDPNPEFTIEQVRAMYAPQYPEITTATVVGYFGKLAHLSSIRAMTSDIS